MGRGKSGAPESSDSQKRGGDLKALSNVDIEKAGCVLWMPFRERVMWDASDLPAELPLIVDSPAPYFIWNDSPKGTHWTAVLIDMIHRTAYVFNSMGLPLDQPVVDALHKHLRIRSVVSNDSPIQASDSASCGYWAVYFLYTAMARINTALALKRVRPPYLFRNAYRYVMDMFSTDDYKRNEEFIEGWWRARGLPFPR